MTATDLLPHLECVRRRGPGKWSARCPSHLDRNPSLTITEGERGILLKCWAGCSLTDITDKLGVSITDLFYDALRDGQQRLEAVERRVQEQAAKRQKEEVTGRRLDALREADALIRSAKGISIETWSDADLHAALDRLGAAYALLESEGSYE